MIIKQIQEIEYLKLELKWDNNKVKTLFHIYEKFSRSGYMFSNLKEDGIYMSYNKDRLAIIGYSLLSYIGLIIVLYVITTIFKEGSRYEKYNFK